MTTIHCRALLFDLDGVLVDSTPAVERVWGRWALAHGFDPAKIVHQAHGRPSIETIREILPNADAEAENLIVERGEIEDTDGVVPLPGAERLLGSLPAERWTIVTSCTRRLAEVRLRAAGLPIPPKMVTSTDIVNGKPHPEPYQKGAAALGIAAADCVVVEDAAAGVTAGKAAGARVIGLTTTMEPHLLRGAGADWLTHNCSSIVASVRDGDHGQALVLSVG
jgi:mannitol-1-/sugar-/sorbitol-6-phosphatase